MTRTKQHLDPKAKRDFSVLDGKDKWGIANWLQKSDKLGHCPFGTCYEFRFICNAMFPEIIKTDHCPCSILYVRDVIKIAKEAIK